LKSILRDHFLGRAAPNPRFERPQSNFKLATKAMSSTSSYGSIEASEAADQGPRRRRIIGAVAVALALSLAIASFSLATPVAPAAALWH
jgi:hypothetical protein